MKKQIKHSISLISAFVFVLILSACGSSSESAQSGITLEVGKVINFSEDITGGREDGWSLPDNGGTWSQSKSAILRFNYGDDFANGMNLKIKAMGFIANEEKTTDVIISANGIEVKKIEFSSAQRSADISIDISEEILSTNGSQLILSFSIPGAVSPVSLGRNSDVRKLGIFLLELIPNKI